MKLRIKISLVFSLVLFLVILTLTIFSSLQTKSVVTNHALSELTIVADIQKDRIEEIIQSYLLVLKINANRTGIIDSLYSYSNNPNELDKQMLLARIKDVKNSIEEAETVFLQTSFGEIATFIGDYSHISLVTESAINEDGYIKVRRDSNNNKFLVMRSPIKKDELLIGYLTIIAKPNKITNVAKDFTGLGDSGETTIAFREINGDAEYINSVRFQEGSPITTVSRNKTNVAIIKALNKEENVFTNLYDYRNIPVIAATRYLKSTDWGMAVKIDKEEINRPMMEKIKLNITVGSTLIIIQFLVVYFLSSVISNPLIKLSSGVKEFSDGNYDFNLDLKGKDEIADLAKEFNAMADKIKNSRIEIEKKVLQQTKEIVEKGKYIENQQQATLNILDDVKEEKEKTEILAKDLEKFKMAVDYASDHIVITDAEGIILYANGAVEKITGFSNNEIIGKKAGSKDLWGGLMDIKVYQKFWKTIKDDKKTFVGDFTNKRKSGENYVARANVSPVLGKNGDVLFFIGIERDITKEKEIDRAKSEFVSLASHQLRTPLTAIKWYTEMLLDGEAGAISEDQKKYLKEISDGNERMVELVNALLNVSRIELGTFSVEPQPTDILKTVRSVLDELKVSIDEKEITIKETHDDLPTVLFDTKLFRIVVQNLLSNSVKYTPEKGTIEISSKIYKKGELFKKTKIEEDTFAFVVKDNGYGIPEGQKDKIFNKLFRADNVKDKQTDGTGLGLYIVKSIIEHSRGKIWFDSIENKGTTFFVLIPLTGMEKKEGSRQIE